MNYENTLLQGNLCTLFRFSEFQQNTISGSPCIFKIKSQYQISALLYTTNNFWMSSLVKHCGYCYSIRRSRSTSRGEEEKRSLDWKFSAQEYEYLCKELQDRRCYWNCNFPMKGKVTLPSLLYRSTCYMKLKRNKLVTNDQIPILPVDYPLYLFMCFSIKNTTHWNISSFL